MAISLYGSINFDKLMEALKSGKVKTYKTENGVRLVNVNVWVNDEADQYGNHASVSLPLKEEYQEEKNKAVYVGNLKKNTPKITEASEQDFQEEDDDLPFW